MKGTKGVVTLAFKAVALAMSVATIVLVILKSADVGSYIIFLSIGLFAIALATIMDYKKE